MPSLLWKRLVWFASSFLLAMTQSVFGAKPNEIGYAECKAFPCGKLNKKKIKQIEENLSRCPAKRLP